MKKRYLIAFIITLLILWLTHPFWIEFKSKYHAHFEFYIFTIILVCGYLFSLKLTQYLADFKNIKNNSRIDIVFLAIFFILLFIPMSHINQEEISQAENRVLAIYKPLFEGNYKINYNFGNDFDAWFNDRFAHRVDLLHLNNYLLYKIAYKYVKYPEGYVNKSNKFLNQRWRQGKIRRERLNEAFEALEQFNEFCNKNNIKLYVLIVPFKELVYNPSGITKRYDSRLIKYIKKHKDINIIYSADEMLEASKKDYVYYKTEHHWTDSGAFAGYKVLMQAISKDFNDIKILNENDFNYEYNNLVNADFSEEYSVGRTCQLLGLTDSLCEKSLDVKYKYFIHKDNKSLNKVVIDKKKRYYYPYGSNHRVILLGTSMGESLSKFVPYSFKNTYRIRTNIIKNATSKDEEFKIMKYYKNEILDYKPNILIFCITYGNIWKIGDLFKD